MNKISATISSPLFVGGGEGEGTMTVHVLHYLTR